MPLSNWDQLKTFPQKTIRKGEPCLIKRIERFASGKALTWWLQAPNPFYMLHRFEYCNPQEKETTYSEAECRPNLGQVASVYAHTPSVPGYIWLRNWLNCSELTRGLNKRQFRIGKAYNTERKIQFSLTLTFNFSWYKNRSIRPRYVRFDFHLYSIFSWSPASLDQEKHY